MYRNASLANFIEVGLKFPNTFYKSESTIPESKIRNDFVIGLLTVDVTARLGSSDEGKGFTKDVKTHPWFASIDWELVEAKKLKPPYRPNVLLHN